jgi:PKD repeat protein
MPPFGFEYKHTFTNLSNTDTSYIVLLVTIDSVNDCRDSLYMDTVFVPGVARARFTVDKDKGCSPLVVAFDNVSNGDITYEWDFGDAIITTTGNDTNVVFTNTTTLPINYFITLTITKDNPLPNVDCYDTYFDTITVYPQFNTVISPAAPLPSCNPDTIDFSQLTTPDVLNLQYEWDFGDGTTSGSSNPLPKIFKHTLGTDQNYQVKLTTTSEFNCKSVATPVNVTVYAFVDAKFTVAPDTAGCSPHTVTIANNSHVNSVKNFVGYVSGILGDPFPGAPNYNIPFNVVFENKGITPQVDTIRLSNNNPPNNCPVSTTKFITVNPEITPHYTKFPVADTICSATLVTFTNTSYYTNPVDGISGAAGTYLWDFGDGTTSVSENPTKQFTNVDPGVKKYLVKLNLTVKGCTRIYTDSVFVYQKVKAQFNTDSTNLCAPITIKLNNTSSGGTSYLWEFFDGTPGTPAVSVSNTNAIYYNVDNTSTNSVRNPKIRLTATTATCSHTNELTLNVYPRIIPLIIPDASSGCGPLYVEFDNQTTGGDATNPLSYSWNFDNSTSSANTISHTFANKNPGDLPYSVSLKATNKLGCFASHSRTITVFPEIESKFSFVKTSECSPMIVIFDNNSLNGNKFNWDFGDGKDTTRSGDFPYTFYHTNANPNLPDNYTITLIVADTNHIQCKDTISYPILINPPVVSSFAITNNSIGCSPLNAEFTNNSTGYKLTYVWNYNDQNTSGDSSVVHTHLYDNLTASSKVYNVKLNAYDINGCQAVDTQKVTAYPKVRANFTLKKDINNTCTPYPINFS